MKAIVYRRYGGPEVLRLEDVARPEPEPHEVLVRIHAASINAADHRLMRANPFLIRLSRGLFAPREPILGADMAGTVERVGSEVQGVAVGDHVFGHTSLGGGFAESICLPATAVAPLPQGLDFEQSASLVLAGFTALQAVRDLAQVQAGQSVLIQGAGGGVGTLLVQVAKAYGADVTAVCGPGSVHLVRSLGADRTIDYTEKDFTRESKRYDAIFGVNGYQSLTAYREALVPDGLYVMVGGGVRQLFEAILLGNLRFAGSGKRIELLRMDHSSHVRDLQELRQLVEEGRLRPVIDRVIPLAETAEAIRYVERGHVRGKVVVRVAGS